MILEVFSCSGGMAEGLRRAGLPVDMAVDADPDACDSYARNLGHRPVQIDVREMLRLVESGWRPAERIDLIVADPPCVPWSRAGKRKGTADERDMLVDTVRLVELLGPERWLIANVPGLDDGPNWPTVQRTIGRLTESTGWCDCGHLVREHWEGDCTQCSCADCRHPISAYCIDFARLDAASYGVPQHRLRPFWYGHPRGTACIQWPERTHGSPEECATLPIAGVRALRPWVTCREALSHLAPEDLGTPVRLRWRGCKGHQVASVPDRPARVVGTSNLSDGNVLAHPEVAVRDRRGQRHHPGKKPRASHIDEPAHVLTTRDSSGDGATLVFDGPNHRPSREDAPARTLTRNTHSDGALLTNARHPINTLDEPSFTVTTKGDGRGAQGACVMAWPWDSPATTLTADPNGRIGAPGHHGKSFLSSPNAIKLSEKAAAILQGFPDGWHFAGATKASRWSQIGQAMPPPLAEAVARAIKESMR